MVYAFFYKLLAIVGRGWAKYRDLSVASRSTICQSPMLRQIIDLRDTDRSRYFAITEFNYCFIIQSPSFFNEYLREAKLSAFFHARTIARRRRVWFRLRMSRILFAAEHFTGEKCLIGRRATTWHCQIQNDGNTSIVCLFQWKED